MYTNNATSEIIESVKMGKHIHIDWKSNLKFIMRNDYLETKRCDLGIGKFPGRCERYMFHHIRLNRHRGVR